MRGGKGKGIKPGWEGYAIRACAVGFWRLFGGNASLSSLLSSGTSLDDALGVVPEFILIFHPAIHFSLLRPIPYECCSGLVAVTIKIKNQEKAAPLRA